MSRPLTASLISMSAMAASPFSAIAADLEFAEPVRITKNNGSAINSGALSSAAGDFNNDGKYEFVSTASNNSSDPHFRIYEYDTATKTFTVYDVLPPAEVNSRLNRFGGDIAVGDIDRDGYVDIILPESATNPNPAEVFWYRNPGGNLGGIWTEHSIAVWSGASGSNPDHMSDIDVGDIDGDGWLDVVTRDVRTGFWVMRQTTANIGDPVTWAPRQTVFTNPREGITLFNPDGDGDLDILLNGVWFETSNNTTTFTQRPINGAAAWYPTTGGNVAETRNNWATQVEVGDFNNDGRTDFAITNAEELNARADGNNKPYGIQVFLAPEDINSAWTAVTVTNQHFSWHSLEIGDLDGDGDLDFISGISDVGVDPAAARIVAYLNNGDGTSFTEYVIDIGTEGGVPVYIYNASIADVDGDGDLDLFAPHNWNSGPIRFYENITVPEPSTGLAALGVAAFISLRRRSRRITVKPEERNYA